MPTLSVDVTAPQAARFQAALGRILRLVDGSGNPRDATNQECKQFLIDTMRGIVYQDERRIAEQAIALSPFDPT